MSAYSVKALENFIDELNFMSKYFKTKEYNISTLSDGDVKELLENVECKLSPENLACDGELRGAALNKKARYLNSVRVELESRLPKESKRLKI